MHGHVEAEVLAENVPFADPAQSSVVPDHYVTRMMVSQGVFFAGGAGECPGSTGARSSARLPGYLADLLRELEAVPGDAFAVLVGAGAR